MILYSLLGFIVLLLVIIAFSKKKIASFDDFKKGANPHDDRSILGEIFNSIGKFFGFIFSPVMLLIIVFLIGGASTVKTFMTGGETQCGLIVERKMELKPNISDEAMLILENGWLDEDGKKVAQDYDDYYYCYVYFQDNNKEIHEASVKYNLYQEFIKDPKKRYCATIFSSDFYMYLITSILLGIFCVGIIIYMVN